MAGLKETTVVVLIEFMIQVSINTSILYMTASSGKWSSVTVIGCRAMSHWFDSTCVLFIHFTFLVLYG